MKQLSPAHEHLESAREALDEGNPQEALRRLTYGFGADVEYTPLYELAVTCLRQIDGEEEAQLFEEARDDFDDAEPFYALGYHFVEVRRYELAIPFLERAHALAPRREDVALELALAYNSRFRPQDARDLLQPPHLRQSFWNGYEYHWASLLCNRPQGVERFVDDSCAGIADAELDVHTHHTLLFVLDKMAEVLMRLQAFPDPRPLVQDWHFIQYGAAILDYFDDRTAEDGLEVAGGRWVVLWGSAGHIAMILHKLKRWLIALDRLPQRVVGLPDRDSEIVARAAAHLLELPFVSAEDESPAQPHTLLVAADNRQLTDSGLMPVLEGQTLFALNQHWLHRGGITPDVAGVMTQTLTLPWSGENVQVDPETRRVTRPEPDTRPAHVIAQELAGTEPHHDPRFDDILAFYQARADYLKGGRRGGDLRLPFLSDSPVPGAYFS
jgi:tetratricopeptide (TPR) repeat protein